MYSKLVCVAAISMAPAAMAHSISARDTAKYASVNRDGAGGHSHSHGSSSGGSSGGSGYGAPQAPASSYSAPAPAPAASYGAPAPSYSAPAPSYSAPEPSYSAPSPSYGEPSYAATGYGEEEGGGLDLTSILIPLLALIGLSLLFPTYVSLTSVRKRRDVGEEAANPMNDVVERVNDIYLAVVESEECMERIACEVGGLAGDVGLKENSLAKMASPFVPLKYKKFMTQFEAGKDCHKLKCGQIF